MNSFKPTLCFFLLSPLLLFGQSSKFDILYFDSGGAPNWKAEGLASGLRQIIQTPASPEELATAQCFLSAHLISLDTSDSLSEAESVCKTILNGKVNGWQKPLARMYLASIYGLQAKYDIQLAAAKNAIETISFSDLDKIEDPEFKKLCQATGTRPSIIEDHLKAMIANAYIMKSDFAQAEVYARSIRDAVMGESILDQIVLRKVPVPLPSPTGMNVQKSASAGQSDRSPKSALPPTQDVPQNVEAASTQVETLATHWGWLIGSLFLLAIIGGVLFKCLRR